MTFTDGYPGFKVEYLKNGALYRHSFYSTLIGNHVEWYHVWLP